MPTIPWSTPVSAESVDPKVDTTALRARIGWLCHLTRVAAAGWAAWLLVVQVWTWSNPAKIANDLGHYMNADLGAINGSEAALAFGASIVAWIAAAAVAYCIWRLFGAYLSGRIFSAEAAAWMQRIGVAGLIAVLVSIVVRRINWLILTSHADLALSARMFTQFVVPIDLLQVLFCLFVLAIGRVFKTAVQIADD